MAKLFPRSGMRPEVSLCDSDFRVIEGEFGNSLPEAAKEAIADCLPEFALHQCAPGYSEVKRALKRLCTHSERLRVILHALVKGDLRDRRIVTSRSKLLCGVMKDVTNRFGGNRNITGDGVVDRLIIGGL